MKILLNKVFFWKHLKGNRKRLFWVTVIGLLVVLSPLILESLMNAARTLAALRSKSTSPVAYWRFDEGSGTVTRDSTNNNNTGSITGAVYTAEGQCLLGKCLRFDGSDDMVRSTETTSVDLGAVGQSYAVSAWIKTSNNFTTSGYIVAKDGTGSTPIPFVLYMNTSEQACFLFGPSAFDTACSTATYNDGKWHHFLGMRHVADDKIYVYVDGVQVGSATDTSSANTQNNSDVVIGNGGSSYNSRDFNGTIDEVKIFNYALTNDQVKAEYNTGAAVLGARDQDALSNGLVGYWKMDEASWTNDCSTASVVDSSGNGNHGKSCPNGSGVSTLKSGNFGNAPSLDGSDDYIDFDNPTLLQTTENFTVSFWVKSETQKTTNMRPISYGNGSSIGWAFVLRGTSQSQPGQLFFQTDNNGDVSSSVRVDDLSWHHIIVTSVNRELIMYVDGVSQNKDSFDSAISYISDLHVGQSHAATEQFAGQVDEFRIYNTGLSPQKSFELYTFAPGPVGYWNFDDRVPASAATDEIKDKSGNGLHGDLLARGRYTSGKYGAGMLRSAVAQEQIDIADNALLKPTGAISVMLWHKFEGNLDADHGNQMLLEKGSQYSIIWADTGQSGCTTPANSLCFRVSTGAAGAYEGASYAESNFAEKTWYHIAGTFDGRVIRLYVNGVLVSSTITTNSTMVTDSLVLCLMDSEASDCSNSARGGYFDEFKIYNYARTPSQIIEDMNGGHPIGGSPVESQVGLWRFDEGQGTTANNSGSGGTSLNGTITGATWSNSGKVKKALDLDGSDDEISVTNSNAIDFDTGLASGSAFSVWVNPDSDGEGDVGRIYHKGTNTYLRVDSESAGALDVEASLDLETTDATVNIAGGIATGAWSHIVVVYNDDGDDEIEVYINGILRGTSTNGVGRPTITDTSNLFIGGDNSTTANFDGKIDEFKVYATGLSAEQVKIDYNRNKATVLGSTGTDTSGNPSNSTDRSYCPPGDTTATCAPVAEWNFEDGSGSTAKDTSGGGNNATLDSTARFARGKIGKGVYLPGVSSAISVNTSTTLVPSSALTVQFWFNAPTFSVHDGVLLSKGGSYSFFSSNNNCSTGNQLCFQLNIGGSAYKPGVAFSTISSNTWHHFVGTYDGSNVRLYVDGVLKDTVAATGTVDYNASHPLCFGESSNFDCSNGSRYSGTIDQVRIYNYARSAAQVAHDYSGGKPIAHWRFDECSGSSAYDSSGNQSVGTLSVGASGTTAIGDCTISATSMRYNGRSGKQNYALDFDGLSDTVQIANDPALLKLTSNMSFLAWIKLSSNTGTGMVVIEKGGSSDNAANKIYNLRVNGSGNLVSQLSDGGSASTLTGNSVLSTGQWYHVAMTYTTGTGNWKVYVNGVVDGTSTKAAAQDLTQNVYIGSQAGTRFWFPGIIDDVRVYNFALTAQQVKEAMNDGAIRYGGS
jgi:hypothetical protein